MTREEQDKVIRILQWLHDNKFLFRSTEEDVKYAIKLAIQELSQEPIYINELVQKAYEDGKKDGYIQAKIEQKSCNDAISRQAVLDLCDKRTKYDIPYEYYEGKKHIRGWDIGKIINMTKLMQLPSVKPQEPQTEWIPIEWKPFGKNGYPKPEDEYKHFLTIDDKGEITIQEFLLSLDEEPQPYFTGMRKIIAWMPLPKPYVPQESEEV